MKKTIIAILSLLIIIACNEKKTGKNLHITGNIKGLQKGTLYIRKLVDTTFIALDTINIDGDSHFESDLNIKSPEMYYLFLDRGVTNSKDNNLSFFAEAGNINIETTLDKYLYNAKITGSKNNDLYKEYKDVSSRFNENNLDLIVSKFNAIKSKNVPQQDSIMAQQNSNTKRKYLYAVNFSINHSDYEVSPYVALTEIYNVNLKYLDTIQKSMTPKVSNSMYGKKLTSLLTERKLNEVPANKVK